MMTLFVNWQDQNTRRWYTVGRLSHDGDYYRFTYTKGAKEAKKQGFGLFGSLTKIEQEYISRELFPLFANRILTKSRPEYREYLDWMDLSDANSNPLMILARSGGGRATDNLQVYPAPERSDDGKYISYFFVNGIRHLPRESIPLIDSMVVGQKLFPMHDFANPFDRNALSLRTDDPAFMIGYCPRYLSPDLKNLTEFSYKGINIEVARLNLDAPVQMRVLCKFESDWPEVFQCAQQECEPITQ